MNYITKSFSTHCIICQKEIRVKCGWCNQIIGEWWMHYKDSWHKLIHHKEKFSRKDAKYFLKLNLVFIPIFVLQAVDIIIYPFKCI